MRRPVMLAQGIVFQARAGDWQITVATEERRAGEVPLNAPDGVINVVATANGPGRQFVRGPRNGGNLTIANDYKRAEGSLQLRAVTGTDTARLVFTFTC